jgi:hypothetical protein
MSSRTALNCGLDPINSHVDIVSLLAPLLCNPFADIGGTVSEFGTARLGEREQRDGAAVDEQQIPQIERDGAWFLVEERPEDVDVVCCSSTADSHDHNTSFAHESVDSAGHEPPFRATTESRECAADALSANVTPRTTVRKWRKLARAASGKLANQANLTNLANVAILVKGVSRT